MSKQSKPTVKNRTRKNEFTTSDGRVVKINPISVVELRMAEKAIEDRYKAEGLIPDLPTYSVSVAGVENAETHEHTDATIADEKDQKVVSAWVKYNEAIDRMDEEKAEINQEIMFVDGIAESPDDDDTWKKRQIRRGITIPKDDTDRKLHWIRSVLLKTTEDILSAIETIMVASMGGAIPADVLASTKASFRLSIQEAAKESSGQGDTA